MFAFGPFNRPPSLFTLCAPEHVFAHTTKRARGNTNKKMSELVTKMIQSGDYKILFDSVKAFRNGFVYGVKVRAPHTLVMTVLWSRPTFRQLIEKIVKASKQHGLNLGKTAFVFRLVHYILTRLIGSESPYAPLCSLLAGGVSGALFWGEQNPINVQVSMYLLSRVLSGLLFAAANKYHAAFPKQAFRAFAGLMWGLVMMLYMHHPETLQTSLQSSMGYIYRESQTYSGLYDLLLVNSPQTV